MEAVHMESREKTVSNFTLKETQKVKGSNSKWKRQEDR